MQLVRVAEVAENGVKNELSKKPLNSLTKLNAI